MVNKNSTNYQSEEFVFDKIDTQSFNTHNTSCTDANYRFDGSYSMSFTEYKVPCYKGGYINVFTKQFIDVFTQYQIDVLTVYIYDKDNVLLNEYKLNDFIVLLDNGMYKVTYPIDRFELSYLDIKSFDMIPLLVINKLSTINIQYPTLTRLDGKYIVNYDYTYLPFSVYVNVSGYIHKADGTIIEDFRDTAIDSGVEYSTHNLDTVGNLPDERIYDYSNIIVDINGICFDTVGSKSVGNIVNYPEFTMPQLCAIRNEETIIDNSSDRVSTSFIIDYDIVKPDVYSIELKADNNLGNSVSTYITPVFDKATPSIALLYFSELYDGSDKIDNLTITVTFKYFNTSKVCIEYNTTVYRAIPNVYHYPYIISSGEILHASPVYYEQISNTPSLTILSQSDIHPHRFEYITDIDLELNGIPVVHINDKYYNRTTYGDKCISDKLVSNNTYMIPSIDESEITYYVHNGYKSSFKDEVTYNNTLMLLTGFNIDDSNRLYAIFNKELYIGNNTYDENKELDFVYNSINDRLTFKSYYINTEVL